MSCSRWMSQALAASVVLGATSTPLMAAVIIGNWEGSADGWADWNAGAFASPKYTYSSTDGITLGTQSLKLEQTGWNQNLSIKLQNTPGLKTAFLSNQLFSIDVTAAATTVEGWSKIEGFVINAAGYGFVGQPGDHLFGWGPGGGGAQTVTLTWNYAHLVDGNAGNGEITATEDSGWIELMLTTNNDGAAHNTFYFDNARLSQVPEPTAAAVALVAGAGLLGRRRMHTA